MPTILEQANFCPSWHFMQHIWKLLNFLFYLIVMRDNRKKKSFYFISSALLCIFRMTFLSTFKF